MLCIYLPSLSLKNLEWWTWKAGQCTCEAYAFPLSWTPIPEIMFFFLMNWNQLYPAYSASLVLNSRFSVSVWLPSLPNTKKMAFCNPCLNQPAGTFLGHLFLRFFVLQIFHSLLPLTSQASLPAKPGSHLFQTERQERQRPLLKLS